MRTQAQLAAAVEAADRGAWEAARDALEEAWRKRPSARIGAIVAAIETRLPKEELPGRTVGERETTWQTLAAERRPAALSLLLHAAWPVHANVTRQRVALLAQWPPSPRIAHALLALASRDEYASVARAKLLRLIIRTVVAWRDPAVNAYLDRVAARPTSAAAQSLRAILRRKRPLEPTYEDGDARALASLEARLAPRDPTARAVLLAAIYAAPRDDGPREVYADVLVQANDPRGELIVLQLARARGERGNLTRERALLREAKRAWFDGLDHDGAHDISLARGFPVRARGDRATFTSPAWATIETLVRTERSGFRGAPLLRGLRRLCGAFPAELPLIELPITELDFLVVIGDELDIATSLAPRMLGLRAPQSSGDRMREVLASLASVPVGRSLRALAFDLPIHQLELGFRYLAAAPASIDELVFATAITVDEAPSRWHGRIAGGHLQLDWFGKEAMGSFVSVPDALRRLSPASVARIRTITIATTARLAPAYLDPTRDKARAVVDTWRSITAAQIL